MKIVISDINLDLESDDYYCYMIIPADVDVNRILFVLYQNTKEKYYVAVPINIDAKTALKEIKLNDV